MVFQNLQKAAEGKKLVTELEARTGRTPGSMRLMQGIGTVVAETEAEAKAKMARCSAYASVEGALALFGGWTGVDLKGFNATDSLGAFESDGMKHLAAFFGEIDPDRLSQNLGIGAPPLLGHQPRNRRHSDNQRPS